MDESHEKQLTETTEQNFLISPSLLFECGLAMHIVMPTYVCAICAVITAVSTRN